MGRMKDLWLDMQEDVIGDKLAKALGLTHLDFSLLGPKITNVTNKHGNITDYLVEFKYAESYPEITRKIEQLEGNTVLINADEVEDWDDDSEEEYYGYHYSAIFNSNSHSLFLAEVESLKKLNELSISDTELKQVLNRQIYISIVGALETFLSDVFITMATNDEKYLRNFVKSFPEFKQRKFDLNEIFDRFESIKEDAKTVMLDTIYHNLPKVKEMYKSTFEIEFPPIGDVNKIILIRHDLVHRNGKRKTGEKVEVDSTTLAEVFTKISSFVEDIAGKLNIKEPEILDF